jgi:hypothetical protein
VPDYKENRETAARHARLKTTTVACLRQRGLSPVTRSSLNATGLLDRSMGDIG